MSPAICRRDPGRQRVKHQLLVIAADDQVEAPPRGPYPRSRTGPGRSPARDRSGRRSRTACRPRRPPTRRAHGHEAPGRLFERGGHAVVCLQRPGAHSKICRDRPPGGQFQARLAQIAGHPAQAPGLPERMTRRQTPKLRGAGGRQKLRRQALRNPGDADQRRLEVFGATGRLPPLVLFGDGTAQAGNDGGESGVGDGAGQPFRRPLARAGRREPRQAKFATEPNCAKRLRSIPILFHPIGHEP